MCGGLEDVVVVALVVVVVLVQCLAGGDRGCLLKFCGNLKLRLIFIVFDEGVDGVIGDALMVVDLPIASNKRLS